MSVLSRLHQDLEDYVSSVLRAAYIITVFVLMTTVIPFAWRPDSTLIILLTGGLLLSAIFYRSHRLQTAVIIYIASLLLTIAHLVIDQNSSEQHVYLFLLPVVAASAMLPRRGGVYTAVVACTLMLGANFVRFGVAGALPASLIPALLCVLLAVVSAVHTHNLFSLVEWAIDMQGKDTQRAEAFFAQKEKLSEALHNLQQAKEDLEHTNKQLAATNARLEQAEHVALQASQAKSLFLSNMSHELRTPLNVIIGYSNSMLTLPEMFDRVDLPPVYRPFVRLIEESGDYLLTLINDILDLGKIEANKLALYSENVELPPLFETMITFARGLVTNKPIVIQADFEDRLPAVYADPTRVRQILLNLLSNAIKFTTSGSVTLSAVLDGEVVRISVSDTGIGIPEYALHHIFDRYQQAEADTDKRYGGTGLGLDISKQLSIMHGGDLTVTSVLGQGSTFTFTLPLARSEQATRLRKESAVAFSAANDKPDEASYLDLLLVLLIEDQSSLRDLIRLSLEDSGYHVVVAHSDHEPVEMADALIPSLIVLDTALAHADGQVIFEKLQNNPATASIPMIILSKTPIAATASHIICLETPPTAKSIVAAARQLAPLSDVSRPASF